MMTIEDLQRLPKVMVIDLYKTAQTVLSDDFDAFRKIRVERAAEWADYCDPTLAPREAELRAKMDQGEIWQHRLRQALGDTRPALVRVLIRLSDEEQFPEPEPSPAIQGGVPGSALDLVDETLG